MVSIELVNGANLLKYLILTKIYKVNYCWCSGKVFLQLALKGIYVRVRITFLGKHVFFVIGFL